MQGKIMVELGQSCSYHGYSPNHDIPGYLGTDL